MYSDFERVFQPCNESCDEFRGEIAPIPRPSFFKRMAQEFLRNIDSVSTKVKEMPRNQSATSLNNLMFCVNSLPYHVLTIRGERDVFIDPHRIYQLTMPGTLREVSATCSRNPIAHLCQFNDVALLGGAKFAFAQRA
jgi:hypothetical protein